MRRLLKLALLFLLLAPCASTRNILQGWFEYYNAQYFSSSLPDGVWANEMYAGAGKDGIPNKGLTFSCNSPARLCISVSPTYNVDWADRKFTLLHEMVHVKLGLVAPKGEDIHGPTFQHEMHRLANEGAFEDIW